MAQVDNPDATDAFVKELRKRKATATSAEALPGLLDYWASWLATGLMLMIGLCVFMQLRQSDKEAERDDEKS
jgi:hypothetical protein